MTNNITYYTVMFEEMSSNMKLVLEAVGQIQEQIKNFVTKDEFHAIWDEISAIKMAVKDTNNDVADHEVRITRLEQAT